MFCKRTISYNTAKKRAKHGLLHRTMDSSKKTRVRSFFGRIQLTCFKILLVHSILKADEFTLSKIWAYEKIQSPYNFQYLRKQYLLKCHKAIVTINSCGPFMSKQNTLTLTKRHAKK
ncbi:hypothetical protein O6H91_23G048200 [Diphasiastrum complanatum]|uniref:Uncharacterized protein n=1 Tax=Diphasiastrum complanatum TaxID=34168 RepID=A0ACC2AAG5_DIPCM|nr:hypothetical protein O6H91_23G048200 [Diphasiastrum complanatum]